MNKLFVVLPACIQLPGLHDYRPPPSFLYPLRPVCFYLSIRAQPEQHAVACSSTRQVPASQLGGSQRGTVRPVRIAIPIGEDTKADMIADHVRGWAKKALRVHVR